MLSFFPTIANITFSTHPHIFNKMHVPEKHRQLVKNQACKLSRVISQRSEKITQNRYNSYTYFSYNVLIAFAATEKNTCTKYETEMKLRYFANTKYNTTLNNTRQLANKTKEASKIHDVIITGCIATGHSDRRT
jgi:hypothetical protein